MSDDKKQITVSIKIPDGVERGVYANSMQVGHTKDEFVLDFINFIPHHNSGVVNSRVILSPGSMKRIINALQDNLSKYEQRYGDIEYDDKNNIGFSPGD